MEPAHAAQEREPWAWTSKLALRICFAYLIIYNLSFPLMIVDMDESGAAPYDVLWRPLVNWVSEHAFHKTITVLPNGSGDTTFNYVQVFIYAVFALVAGAVWALIDRRRRNDKSLYDASRILVRYVLIVAMLMYGLSKVFFMQFMAPGPVTLLGTWGESSPMHVLWTFMGASKAYTIFAGLGECLGAVLLVFRRTTTLGALVSAAILTNVVMLNFCYDVPVKLYSGHLLLMALFLVLPDAKRIFQLFIGKQPIEPADQSWRAPSRGWAIARWTLKYAFIAIAFFGVFRSNFALWQQYGEPSPKPQYYGMWDVTSQTGSGARLKQLAIDRFNATMLVYEDGHKVLAIGDFGKKSDTLKLSAKTGPVADFAVRPMPGSRLSLTGKLAGQDVSIVLQNHPLSEYPLVGRGFHWINEFPNNSL
ncbi:MAG: hypothetical protein JSS66_17385 [Armatimonadetes bacterium]|nr:hypothetical protein [Armatimonadota bacterium]